MTQRSLPDRAVIFDLDGCLVDSEPLSIGAIIAEMAALGIPGTTFEAIRDSFLGVSMRVICDHVAKKLGVDCPPDFTDRVERRLFESYRTGLRLIDGVEGLLDRLEGAGIPFAIATGGSIRRMTYTLDCAGLTGRFPGRAFSADQVARGKPAPDIFLFAAAQLQVAPSACVVVEDSPLGVAGAVAAGARAVGFVGGSHLDGRRGAHGALLAARGASPVLPDMSGMFEAVA